MTLHKSRQNTISVNYSAKFHLFSLSKSLSEEMVSSEWFKVFHDSDFSSISRGVWGVHHSRVNIQLPLKCCFTEVHEDDQSLTLYDEVFPKTRNLFETYQKHQIVPETPSLGLSSIFVGSSAKKTTNIGIGVIRQWSSYPPYIRYRNMIFIGSWLTEWILEEDPEGSST
jgi:hypothetical protein